MNLSLEGALKQCNYGITSSMLNDLYPEVIIPHTNYRRKYPMPAYLINMDKLQPVHKFKTAMDADAIGQKSKFKYLVLEKEEDLTQFPVKKLVNLKENLTGEKHPSDRKKAKGETIPSVWKLIEEKEYSEPPELPKKEEKVPKKDREPSKIDIVRECFKEKDVWTRDELIEKTGYSIPACRHAMQNLKNPKKMKVLLLTTYDRKEKTYTLTGHK